MPKKAAGTQAMTKWNEELARQATLAAGIVEGVGQSGQWISLRAGRMTIDGAPVPDNKLSGVVIDYILENGWYEGDFDPDNPASPVCYAFARALDDLRPVEGCEKPQGGPEGACAGCEKNEYGTAERGKGKACGNHVRMAVITEASLENIAKAEVRYIRVPVTSVKGWASYVRQIASVLHVPPFAVVTEIEEVPDEKSQFKLLFTVGAKIEDASQLEELIELKRRVEGEIEFKYPPNTAKLVTPRGVQRRGQTQNVRRAAATVVPPSARVPARAASAPAVRGAAKPGRKY